MTMATLIGVRLLALRGGKALEVEAEINAAGLGGRQHGLAEIGLDLEFGGVDGGGQYQRRGECKCERGGSDRRHGNCSSLQNVESNLMLARGGSGLGRWPKRRRTPWLKKEIAPRCWPATRGDDRA